MQKKEKKITITNLENAKRVPQHFETLLYSIDPPPGQERPAGYFK